MKKILRQLLDMTFYAMASAITAWVSFGGINMIIEDWQRPWDPLDVLLRPLFSLVFGGLSILIGCFSILCFIGIFKSKAWREN
ncbi:hypothetical protein N9R35_00165 [bacterium]|nr:hypothetical protein [bacterium]